MRDGLQGPDGDCWKDRRVLQDPHCEVPIDRGFGPVRSVRGGAWILGTAELAPARRKGSEELGFAVENGLPLRPPFALNHIPQNVRATYWYVASSKSP